MIPFNWLYCHHCRRITKRALLTITKVTDIYECWHCAGHIEIPHLLLTERSLRKSK